MLHVPASGRGAQRRSACIKTMSVCFIKKMNAFFFDCGVYSDQYSASNEQRFSLRAACSACSIDRLSRIGMHRGCSGKQVTCRLSICKPKRFATTFGPLLKRHACHHVSLSGSPRVREESNMLIPSFCAYPGGCRSPAFSRVARARSPWPNKRHASRYRAVWHWHYQCQNKCASSRRLLERRSCGLRLAVQWAKERYLCITGAVASDLEATYIAPHECNSIPYLGRDWPPACASDAVQQ
jgi:hypothetical protein